MNPPDWTRYFPTGKQSDNNQHWVSSRELHSSALVWTLQLSGWVENHLRLDIHFRAISKYCPHPNLDNIVQLDTIPCRQHRIVSTNSNIFSCVIKHTLAVRFSAVCHSNALKISEVYFTTLAWPLNLEIFFLKWLFQCFLLYTNIFRYLFVMPLSAENIRRSIMYTEMK